MLIGGIIIGVVGAVVWFTGVQINSDIRRSWSSYWDTGQKDPTGDILIFIGVALVIIGVLLFVFGLYKKGKNTISYSSNKIYNCPKCNAVLTGGEYTCPDCKSIISWNQILNEENSPLMWTCPKCGRDNYNNVRWCSCGQKKTVITNTQNTPEDIKNYWHCPKCGKYNYNYVGSCGCGLAKSEADAYRKNKQIEQESESAMDESKIIKEPQHNETTDNNKYCTNCGELLNGAKKFCANCGTKVE